MRNIIKDGSVVADHWTTLRLADDDTPETYLLPQGAVIVPLSVWQAQWRTLAQRGDVGVWFASHERIDAVANDVIDNLADGARAALLALPVLAIEFPKFTDGRGYSIAYLVRGRLGYTGELRAIGDVLRDQLFFMQRVGFNAFEVRADRDVHDALKGLSDFSQPYQNSVDQPAPLFRRLDRLALPESLPS